ncbi:hypothetical protein [Desulfosporosinus hippei]|uniref:Uncharacterized protein n=1 Tax=Desulfosporosinus hippei DSM 8344 TaxID=1121419 RepID=A0A1G8ASP6_9FIRM|nr:hypothetical protein [Desulfosporosinus hippei]SDH23985.1 hypothetical protein SAMN05443529_111109 [Desulfosporosinus hippei DSM 8344]
MHGEAVKPTSLGGEAEPRVHIRYYPEVWHESVRWTFSLKRQSPKNTYPLKIALRQRVGQPRNVSDEDTVFARINWSCTDVGEAA